MSIFRRFGVLNEDQICSIVLTPDKNVQEKKQQRFNVLPPTHPSQKNHLNNCIQNSRRNMQHEKKIKFIKYQHLGRLQN